MKKILFIWLLTAAITPTLLFTEGDIVVLPKPGVIRVALDEALGRLKTERAYADRALSLDQIATLLWAATGRKQTVDALTAATRTYASAAGIYPLRMYVVVGAVQGMNPGVYEYLQKDHALKLLKPGDIREEIAIASQLFVYQAPITFFLAADYKATTEEFGDRGKHLYIPIEAGAASQNLRISAAALGLSVGIAGQFDHTEMKELLNINDDPLLLLTVGYNN